MQNYELINRVNARGCETHLTFKLAEQIMAIILRTVSQNF